MQKRHGGSTTWRPGNAFQRGVPFRRAACGSAFHTSRGRFGTSSGEASSESQQFWVVPALVARPMPSRSHLVRVCPHVPCSDADDGLWHDRERARPAPSLYPPNCIGSGGSSPLVGLRPPNRQDSPRFCLRPTGLRFTGPSVLRIWGGDRRTPVALSQGPARGRGPRIPGFLMIRWPRAIRTGFWRRTHLVEGEDDGAAAPRLNPDSPGEEGQS
jgi:hypothetical protein